MCDPVLGAAIGVSVVSGILKHKGQEKQARVNAQLAREDLALQYADFNARAQEEMALTSQQRTGVQQEAAALTGEVVVGAAEGNVAGASVTAYVHDLAVQESNAIGVLDANLDMVLGQVERAKRGAQAEARGRIAGVSAPSPLATGIGILGSSLGMALPFISRGSGRDTSAIKTGEDI